LLIALAVGAAAAFILLLASLGVRPDIAAASSTVPFWVKWAFTLSVAGISLAVLLRLGQPGVRAGWLWFGLAAPFAIIAMMSVGELLSAPSAARVQLLLGSTALVCPIAITSLSIPTFVGLVWAFRKLAPTNPRLAGAAAGMLAAAVAASIYAFVCPEESATFMITWYSLGLIVSTCFGALVGRRLFSW